MEPLAIECDPAGMNLILIILVLLLLFGGGGFYLGGPAIGGGGLGLIPGMRCHLFHGRIALEKLARWRF